jgi:hypothetical protein
VCSSAVLNPITLAPADQRFINVAITGVTDPDGDPLTIGVTRITQDEALSTSPCGDGAGLGTAIADLRAVRRTSRGRVYRVTFTADDGRGGQCTRTLNACVAGSGVPSTNCTGASTNVDSTAPACTNVCAEACSIERTVAHAWCPGVTLPGRLSRSLESVRRNLVRVASDGTWSTGREDVLRSIDRASQATEEERTAGTIPASCAASIQDRLSEARAAVPS